MLIGILSCHLSVTVRTLSGHLGGHLAWIVVVFVTKPALPHDASLVPNGPF